MGLEAGQIGRIDHQTAAGGDDGVAAGAEGTEHHLLVLTEGGLAPLGEDVGDGLPDFIFDQFVGVNESEAEMLGGQAADGGFARAHETDQGKIANGARMERTQRLRLSTPPSALWRRRSSVKPLEKQSGRGKLKR